MQIDRIVLVTKATRWEDLVKEHMTESATQFYLESSGISSSSYEDEHKNYKEVLDSIRSQIPNDIQVVNIERKNLPTMLLRDNDFIIACGPDGLFANLAKYVQDQMVLTINPDPTNISGVLMLHNSNVVSRVIKQIKEDTFKFESLPFIKGVIDDSKIIYGINDLFIGRDDQRSAYYKISFGSRNENQSSSGVIVSTGVGSTGWMKSIYDMISSLSGYRVTVKLPSPTDKKAVFVVREAFSSPNTKTSIIINTIDSQNKLELISSMSSGGVVFVDGVNERYLPFNTGSKIVVSIGDRVIKRII